jgi:hypothetical protein
MKLIVCTEVKNGLRRCWFGVWLYFVQKLNVGHYPVLNKNLFPEGTVQPKKVASITFSTRAKKKNVRINFGFLSLAENWGGNIPNIEKGIFYGILLAFLYKY